MYSTCLYCSKHLGRNTVLELLPIGRRLAFDGAKGRLWVVCRSCAKWNLVPFENRLEVIDACEREFRDTRTRYSTDHIGLARHREGLELVRIGPALRPEFAAWRYGEEFVRRRRRAMLATGVAGIGTATYFVAGIGTMLGATAATGGAILGLPAIDLALRGLAAYRRHADARAVLRDPRTGYIARIPFAALRGAELEADDHGRWHLEIPYFTGAEHLLDLEPALPSIMRPGSGRFDGEELMPALGRVLPALNGASGPRWRVGEAVKVLESAGDPERLLEFVAGRPLRYATRRNYVLRDVPDEVRLAIEMSAHEETERRALEGELRLLERHWKEAEEVAAIADGLVLGQEDR
jgi:hypothetical protein